MKYGDCCIDYIENFLEERNYVNESSIFYGYNQNEKISYDLNTIQPAQQDDLQVQINEVKVYEGGSKYTCRSLKYKVSIIYYIVMTMKC